MGRKSSRLQEKKEGAEKKQEVENKQQQKPADDAEEKQNDESKSKKIIKAKKYKHKSYDEQLRINKSKIQRIFLLSAQRSEQSWQFTVQGTTGNHYHVSVSTFVHCTCRDYIFKKIPCKHIYFIVTQVGQNDELLDYFKKDRKISKNAYKILDEQLASRLKSRLEKPSKDPKQIDLKDDTDCVICFTEMNKDSEALQDCGTCKKYFHTECIAAWKAHNPSCPLCRGALTKQGTSDDPLGKLVGIKL